MYAASVTVLLLFFGLFDCARSVPTKPHLSSFTAELSVLGAGTEIKHVQYYANAKDKKQLQVVALGSEEEKVYQYTWIFVNRTTYLEYDNLKPFDICSRFSTSPSPGDSNVWFWMANATYTGTKTFMNEKVDVWTYEDKVNENFYQVGVLSNNPDKPVYFFSTRALGVIVFKSYDNSVPDDSVFDIPASCKVDVLSGEMDKAVINHKSSLLTY